MRKNDLKMLVEPKKKKKNFKNVKVYLKIGSSKTFSGVCEVVTLIEWINNNVKKQEVKQTRHFKVKLKN